MCVCVCVYTSRVRSRISSSVSIFEINMTSSPHSSSYDGSSKENFALTCNDVFLAFPFFLTGKHTKPLSNRHCVRSMALVGYGGHRDGVRSTPISVLTLESVASCSTVCADSLICIFQFDAPL